MPAGDGTGPMGMGPMSGRGAGYCTGYGMPGRANRFFGWGRGMMRAGGPRWVGGHGWRHWYHATGLPRWARMRQPHAGFVPPFAAAPAAEQEAEFLRGQAEWLREQLDAVSERIAELEKESPR